MASNSVRGAVAADEDPPSADPGRALILLLAAITASGPVALNVYLPALPLLQADFGVSLAHVQSTLSIALIAFAAGILVYGPLSDRFGRRPVVLGGLAIFLLGTAICLAAPSIEILIAGRAIQSLGAAAGLVVSRAIVGDLYNRDGMAKALAYLTMVMVLGPTVSPLLGGWIAVEWHWRGTFVFLLALGSVIALLAWRWLPETRPATTHASGASAIARASAKLLSRPAFAGYVLQVGVIYATFLVFISLAPYVMVDALRRPPTEYGLYYLLLALGYFLGNWSVTRLASRKGVEWLMLQGVAIAAIACIAALGLVAIGLVHPLAIFLPIGVLGFGQGLALPNITASAVALAPGHTGVASSLLGFAQQLIGAGCVQAMSLFATDTPYPMLTFCAVSACIAWFGLMLQNRWWPSASLERNRPPT
ncbi:MAG TPA: multidrug effflux MFS transporter [Steroidobacteraceae bacterium]|nr:multidrug effflux MFS transporter [Steroidobacteraceae bacterium]